MPLAKKTYLTFFLKPKKYFFIFLWFLCLTPNFYGQQSIIDSLKNDIASQKAKDNFNSRDKAYINSLNELANELRFYNTDSLFILSNQALQLSNEIDYKIGQVESLNYIGDYYSKQGDQEKAIQKYQAALSIAKETGNANLILNALNGLANQFAFNQNYAKALNQYLEGIEIAKEFDKKRFLVLLTENMALLYADQHDSDEALFYYKTVKKLNEELGDDTFTAASDSNIAEIYMDIGNTEYAMYHINKAISVFEKHGMIDWLAYAFQVKGTIYLKQHKFKWAMYWFDQSKMLYDKTIQDDRAEIYLLTGIAEANMGIDKDSISESYALRALEISTKLKDNVGLKQSASVLYKLAKKKNDFKNALRYHETVQQLSDTILRNNNLKSLIMLKTKLKHDRQKEELITENEKALAKQKNYIYASLAILLILLAITLLVRRNEHIQKKLNKELNSKKNDLEKRELELEEINATKDKLFSIIGHDLRGPIGAFRGLLQLFKSGEISKTEFLSFIPKLATDIDHISFTLNNLLSWGQTQMKGTVIQPTKVCLANLIDESINLLSEIAHKKSIEIVNQVKGTSKAWTDVDQIDIVIRNLMSNALKFTPKDGKITIAAIEKNNHWEVSVRDTGVGIDKETQEKIFAKNANVTTYGTDNEKGTGLGLSLCKEMVENNKGTIWVESTLKKGTCFYFTVPKLEEKYEKAS